MYLGCHTPKDVLVSFAVTIVISGAVSFVFDNFNSTLLTDILVSVLVFTLSAALFGYSYYLVGTGATTDVLAMDCFKAAGAGAGFAVGWFIEKHYIRFNPKNSHLWLQILKVVIGLAGALIIKSGLKLILGNTMLSNTVRYFFVILWIAVGFPLIIKKLFRER